jgi:hypothetical protein
LYTLSNRLWQDSHVYIKDILLETLLGLSLHENIVNPNEEDFSVLRNQVIIQQKLSKMLVGHNILRHLLNLNFGIDSDNDDLNSPNYDSFILSPAIKLNSHVQKSERGWDLRREIVSSIDSKESFECEIITMQGSYHGVIYLFNAQADYYLYFRSYNPTDSDEHQYSYLDHKFKSLEDVQRISRKEVFIKVSDIEEIVAKNFLCRPSSFEIFDAKASNSFFFNMFTFDRRKFIFNTFKRLGIPLVEDCRKFFKESKYQEKWSKYKISTLDYLLLVNKYASRSFNDTSQYPIMPWVGPCGVDELGEVDKLAGSISPRKGSDLKSI